MPCGLDRCPNLFAGFSAILEFMVTVFCVGIAHYSKVSAAAFAYLHEKFTFDTFSQKNVIRFTKSHVFNYEVFKY